MCVGNVWDIYPIILPVLGHTLVAYSPYPRVTGENVGILITIIVFAPLRVTGIHLGYSVLDAMICLILRLIFEVPFIRTGRVYFGSGFVLLRSIMPTVRSIVRMPISGVGLDVIIVSATTKIILPLRIGLTPVISLATSVIGIHVTRARLSKGIFIIVRLRMRRSLIRSFFATIMLILILRILIALKSRWSILLRVDTAIVLRIRRRDRIATSSFITSMVIGVSRRRLIAAAPSSLTPIAKVEIRKGTTRLVQCCNSDSYKI